MSASSVNSFDVFDTALTRRVAHPDHLHWLTARRLQRLGLVDCGEDAFRSHRIRAEWDCRAGGREPDLGDIYRELAVRLGWTAEAAGRAMAVEVEEEDGTVVPVASTLRLHGEARARHARPIFVSDTYFRAPDVLRLLRRCGYEVEPEDVHASCDYACTKADGRLFRAVADGAGRPVRTLHHTGDNRTSDHRNARRAGLRATWIGHTALNRYEAAMLRAGGGGLEGSLAAGAARAARLSRAAGGDAAGGDAAVWTVGASVAGPLVTSFVLWTLLEAERRGLRRLYFLARDGQIMLDLARRLAAWAGLDVECRYMLASRQAYFMASLPPDPAEALASALALGRGKTAAAVLRELEFGAARAGAILARAGLDGGRVLGGPGREADALAGALDGDDLAALAAAVAERTRALAAYLEAEAFLDGEPRAIVDLGWQGNLQLRLDRCLDKIGAPRTFGLYYSLHVCPPAIAAAVATYTQDTPYNPHLLEVFCLADHASTRHFAFDGRGRAVGVGRDEPDAEALAWGVLGQQAAMAAFCSHLAEAPGAALVDPRALAPALRSAAEAALQLFTRWPGFEEAQAYGRVLHSSDQTHSDSEELAPVVGTLDLARSLLSARHRRDVSKWAGGTLARSTRPALRRALTGASALQRRAAGAARALAGALAVKVGARA